MNSRPTPTPTSTPTSTTTEDVQYNSPPPIERNGTGSSSSSQACAACKHQRRRCGPDCRLAPYFPANKQKEFANAHKLFGVSNINKILKLVPEHHKANAMNSVIVQAHMRARDPVGGCHRVILDLEKRIEICTAELNMVRKKVAFYRQQHHLQRQMHVNYFNAGDHMQGRSSNNYLMQERSSNNLMQGRSNNH